MDKKSCGIVNIEIKVLWDTTLGGFNFSAAMH